MQDYYHCVPGRMRIKIQALKHQPGRGNEVKTLLIGLDGVTAVTFTALTGSLVVFFDPARIDPDRICECLIERGLIDPALATASNDQVQDAVTQAGLRIGRVAVGWALGKALQANGLSLLAALI
jgi:hypothetical protein